MSYIFENRYRRYGYRLTNYLEYSIDFSEPIPKMVQRLKAELRDFRIELIKIEDVSEFSSQKAIEMLKEIRKSILRHRVEEEARIIRIIMQKAKEQSEQSIKILQEHKDIINFLEKTINHFSEEEEIVFPLTLKANSM